MTSKKPKLALLFIVSVMIVSFIVVGCSNSGNEKKETLPDTTKMDTATTRPPVKTTN
ncbi:MAG: hypothetical protein WDO71_06195 [Bacteroidota bacterium]